MTPLTPPADMPPEPEGEAAMRRLGIYVEWRKWALQTALNRASNTQTLTGILADADTIVAWMFKEHDPT
jgi:hypothetical protein